MIKIKTNSAKIEKNLAVEIANQYELAKRYNLLLKEVSAENINKSVKSLASLAVKQIEQNPSIVDVEHVEIVVAQGSIAYDLELPTYYAIVPLICKLQNSELICLTIWGELAK